MSDDIVNYGLVQRILDKGWNGKIFYSFKTNDIWYGLGTHSPNFKEGDKVTFQAKQNKKGFWEAIQGTLSVVPGENKVVSNGSVGAVVKTFGGKDDYWLRKEQRDLKQDELREIGATRNTAIEWIKALLQFEAIKLPGKVADREDFLKALLEDYVTKFRNSANGITVTEPAETPLQAGKQSQTAEDEIPWN